MQTLSVVEKGIWYIFWCMSYYSEGCAYFALYIMGLLYLLVKGNKKEKVAFLWPAYMMLFTVYNPIFPVLLNHVFDVNNEYYRFFWIAPVVILISYLGAKYVGDLKGIAKIAVAALCILIIISSGRFLYRDGFIKSPNIYKMPTEIPEIAELIHKDSDGRYDGEYYPRAAFELDYEMSMRQYDASIMLVTGREAYLNAIQGKLTQSDILSDENFYNRVLAVVALNQQIAPAEFKKGLENTGTEYICITTANEDMCRYLEKKCKLRVVGKTANHTLYHYKLKGNEGFTLPDYSDVWENY